MFKLKMSNTHSADGTYQTALNTVQSELAKAPVVTTQHSKLVLSTESLQDSQRFTLDDAASNLEGIVMSMTNSLNVARPSPVAMESAIYAGLLAADPKAIMGRKLDFSQLSTESMAVIQPSVGDGYQSYTLATEAFNNVDNRSSLAYTIAYNYMSAEQDEVTSSIYPTVVVAPNTAGVDINVNLMVVHNGLQHKISGVFEEFQRKNLIRALADYTILNKNETLMVPVLRAQSADQFVDPALVPASDIMVDNQSIHTAPLKIGKRVNLIGISQTDAMLALGNSDHRDSIEPAVTLKNVYAQFGTDVVKFNVRNLSTFNFIAVGQNDNRIQNLNAQTTSILLNASSREVDGTALDTLAPIVTGDLTVRLEVQLSGAINIETGSLDVFGNTMRVHSITDNTEQLLAETDPRYVTIAGLISAGVLFGYEIEAYRSNANRRQRGQLVTARRFANRYNVPLRSPIAAERPAHADGSEDASDLQALVMSTRTRIANEAITHLFDTAQTLNDFVDSRDVNGLPPDVLGSGRYYVVPTYFKESLDLTQNVNSLVSSERAEDIQAALVVKIRDLAARLYTYSQYKAAADALTGGTQGLPTVTVVTDPVLARYLLAPGDLRTAGNGFELKVATTIDYRMRGKMFLVFTTAAAQSGNVDVLNYGNLFWSPELVLAANMTRQGGYNKETQVQPRYLFVAHCPIMAELDVTGVPEVLRKVPYNFHSV